MKFKKAQGMSMNVIIIAVIALLVLGVIIFIFSGKMRGFTGGLANCDGECRNSCGSNEASFPMDKCSDKNPSDDEGKRICCLPMEETP